VRERREKGTIVRGHIRISQIDYADVCDLIKHLVPPVPTYFNGTLIERPALVTTFKAKLPCQIAENGVLKDLVRVGMVEVYAGDGSGKGEILEMGIPVVQTDNGYVLNCLQKVPLGTERDNVPPAFLRAIQAALLNAVAAELEPEEVSKPWVQEAAGNANAKKETVKAVLEKQFGEHAVVATPGDPLANATAEHNGFAVIHGGSLSAPVWAAVKKHDLLKSSASVFHTPKPEELAQRDVCPKCGRPV
jgi:hypothetical protein